MEEGCLVANSLLDIHVERFHVQVIKTKNCTEVGNDLRNTDDHIGALLARQIIKFEVYLETSRLLWVIRLLQTCLHRKCRALLNISAGKQEEASSFELFTLRRRLVARKLIETFVVHDWQVLWHIQMSVSHVVRARGDVSHRHVVLGDLEAAECCASAV